MSVLVDDMLQGKGLMCSAEVWPVACLCGGAKLLLLCVVNEAQCKNACRKPADRLTHSYGPVVGCVGDVTLLEDGRHKGGLPRLRNLP